MYQKHDLNGLSLGQNEICLTYDDGPGTNTLEIARFLHQHHIRAAFFVVGKFASRAGDILAELSKLGHLVCNHTYEHPDMPYYVSVNGDPQDQILRTDVLIHEYVNGNTIFFRPPYGKWSPEVAEELNSNLLTAFNHVGPIHWEVPGIDCYFWDTGRTVDEAVDEYMLNIKQKGKGIVVMHDDIADMDIVKSKNKTLELTRKLVPKLLEAGYTFKSLDEIPEIKTEMQRARQIMLLNYKGRNIKEVNGRLMMQPESTKSGGILLEVIFGSKGKVYFKTPDDFFVSVSPENHEEVLLRKELDIYSEFDYIHIRNNKFFLRTFSGKYLCIDKSSVVRANVQHMRQAEIFRFALPYFKQYRKPFTLKKRIELAKKRFRFIKSKILQG